jgi:hypothetical protein
VSSQYGVAWFSFVQAYCYGDSADVGRRTLASDGVTSVREFHANEYCREELEAVTRELETMQ